MFRHLALLLLLSPGLAARAGDISFSRQIAPLLVEQCVECHRADKAKGGYRLDTWRELQRAGDSEAPPLVPGQPEQSELFRLIVTGDEDDRMPQKADPLPAEQAALIREWIAGGAKFDGGKDAADQPLAALIPEEKAAKAPERYPQPLPVIALAPHPDGETLAVGGYREVTLWRPETHELMARLGGLPERVLALEWLPRKDGKPLLLAAGGVPGRSGGLWLIDPEAADSAPRRLLQTRDCMMALAAGSDGSRAVVAGADNAVRCVALPSGKPLWSIEAHADWVLDLALSPDGKKVATASRDRSARLIDLASGEIDATFTAHSAPVCSVVIAADGQTVFTGDAGGEIRRWNLEGEGVKDSTLRAGRSEVTALQRAGDLLLATLADGRLVPLQPEARKALEPLARIEDRFESLRVTPELGGGWRVFAGGHDGSLHRIVLSAPPAQEEKKQVSEGKDQKATVTEDATSEPLEAPKPVPPLQFIVSPGWSPS